MGRAGSVQLQCRGWRGPAGGESRGARIRIRDGGRVRWLSCPGSGTAEEERESCRRNTLWKCRLQIPLEALIHSQQLPGYFDYEIINHFIVFSLGGVLFEEEWLSVPWHCVPQLCFFSWLLCARLKPSAYLQL